MSGILNCIVKRMSLLTILVCSFAVAETTAVVGGKVHTVGPQGTVENATIIIVDGTIAAVGQGIGVPDGAETIDASGKIVTPGLFTPIGTLGLVEIGLSAGPLDALQRGEQFTAGFDVADAYNSRSTVIAVNRIEGVTRALIAPMSRSMDSAGNSSHVISGLAAVVNLGNGDDYLDQRGAAMVVNLGENGSGYGGGSRTGALLILRNALDEAIDYRDHKDDFERGMRRTYQHSIADLEALESVLSGRTPLLANVNRASDIESLIRLSAEYEIRAIISGGAEAWMLAERLASADIAVILAPMSNLPADFDQINARRGAATILVAAGVRVAFADARDHTHNARNITQSAGNAVGDGLSWDAALRAITLAPAEIYGVADRVGSIEIGKQADIVIWPADPLELTSYPDQVLINGEAISMVSRQSLLRDRYLQLDSGEPPAYRGH